MDALLYWLHVGLAGFLAFLPVQADFAPGRLELSFQTAHALTDQMKELVTSGLDLELELYVSLHAISAGGKSTLSIRRVRRLAGYDFRSREYFLREDLAGRSPTAQAPRHFRDLAGLEQALCRYPPLGFHLPDDWKKTSAFARLTILDNQLLTERFGLRGLDLWDGYQPSVTQDWERP
jgi:hypothetical protein